MFIAFYEYICLNYYNVLKCAILQFNRLVVEKNARHSVRTSSFVAYKFVESLVEVSHSLKVFIAFKTSQPNP